MRLSGLEPETFRLSGGCSNQLSYRRIKRRPLVGSRVKAAVKPPSLAQAGHGIIGYRLSKTGLHREWSAASEDTETAPRLEPGLATQSLQWEDIAIWIRPAPEGAVRNARPAIITDSVQVRRIIPRKEVIQPHLPIRLPCYDLVPLTGFTFGASILAVRTTTSGATNSGGLTGGVYKAQEQSHRGVADPRLLAIPASCGRIAAHNLN